MRRVIPWLLAAIFILNATMPFIYARTAQAASDQRIALADYRHRMVAYLISNQHFDEFKMALPASLRVLAVQDEMVILTSSSELGEKDLKEVRGLPMVRGARLDSVVQYEAKVNAGGVTDCDHSSQGIPQVVVTTMKNAQNVSRQASCAYEQICPKQSMEKLWAQRAVDADLMNEYIESHKLRAPGIYTPVAVVDSGFNETELSAMVQGRKIAIIPGVYGVKEGKYGPEADKSFGGVGAPLVPDGRKDKDGHGTMVTSVIAGKSGMGVAPRAEITVLNDGDETGRTSMAFAEYAIRYACNKAKKTDSRSTPIINLSAGAVYDEMGSNRDEKSPLMEFLLKEGCLVTKAGGNATFTVQDSSNNGTQLDDPYLRVGASSKFGGKTDFSSIGEVSAPGEDVYVRTSPIMTQPLKKACGDETQGSAPREGFVNGTSFSAPITAGILSEVSGVLRSGHKFDSLPASSRVALLNRIIKASSLAGMVNGLRAVMIAEAWNQMPQGNQLPSLEQLQDLLKSSPHPLCKSPSPACQNTDSCSMSCYKEARIRVTACVPPSHREAVKLFEQLTDSGAIPSAYRVLQILSPESSESEKSAHEYKLVETYLDQLAGKSDWSSSPSDNEEKIIRKSLNQSFAQGPMSGYLRHLKSNPTKDAAKMAESLVRLYLRSQSFAKATLHGPARGSNDVYKAALDRLEELRSILGDDRFSSFIKSVLAEPIDLELKDLGSKDELDVVQKVRILNAIASDRRFSKVLPSLKELNDSIFEKMDAEQLRDLYARDSDSAVLLNFGLDTPVYGPYFKEFLERTRPLLSQQLKKWDPETISLTKLNFAAANVDSFFASPEDQNEFLLQSAMARAARADLDGQDKGHSSLNDLARRIKSKSGSLDNYVRTFLNQTKDPILLLGAQELFQKKAPFILTDEDRASTLIKAFREVATRPASQSNTLLLQKTLHGMGEIKTWPSPLLDQAKKSIEQGLHSWIEQAVSQASLTEGGVDAANSWIRPVSSSNQLGQLVLSSPVLRADMKTYLEFLKKHAHEVDRAVDSIDDLEQFMGKSTTE